MLGKETLAHFIIFIGLHGYTMYMIFVKFRITVLSIKYLPTFLNV